MRRLFFLFVCLAISSTTYSQKTRATRFISFFEASESGYRSVFSLSQIPIDLFDGARQGVLPIYYAESLSRDPQKISWSDLGKRISANDVKRYPVWRRDIRYYPFQYHPQGRDTIIQGSTVSYADRIYQANRESINIPPTDSLQWQALEANIETTLLGLDFRVLSGDTVLQYIHCFRDSLTYLASFRASEVIPLLNASRRVAYTPNPTFGGHVTGDLFLFESNDVFHMIRQLWPILDTAKVSTKKDELFGYSECSLMVSFGNEKLANLYLAWEKRIEDTISGSKVAKFIATHHPTFFLEGDALSRFQKMGVKLLKLKYFKPIGPVEGPPRPVGIERLEYTRDITFAFNWQHPDQQFVRNINTFLDLIYAGVVARRIRVFKSPSLQTWYKPEELVLNWAIKDAEEWNESDAYGLEEVVVFKGRYYCSTEGSNRGNVPSANPNMWIPDKITLLQPGHVESISITSILAYDTQGLRVRKNERFLELSTQMKSLGYFDVGEVRTFMSLINPMLWDQILKWIDTNGIVSITTSPLTAAE